MGVSTPGNVRPPWIRPSGLRQPPLPAPQVFNELDNKDEADMLALASFFQTLTCEWPQRQSYPPRDTDRCPDQGLRAPRAAVKPEEELHRHIRPSLTDVLPTSPVRGHRPLTEPPTLPLPRRMHEPPHLQARSAHETGRCCSRRSRTP